jgi:hypothetical protein
MADSELLVAVRRLVRRLRRFFLPHGHPPEPPIWQVQCSAKEHAYENHPLKRSKANFGWLLGNPDGDQVLTYALEKFEPLRKTAAALKRVGTLIEATDQSSAHFRAIWKALLDAPWAQGLSRKTRHLSWEDKNKSDEFYIGFTAATVDQQLLADLIEAAHLNSQPAASRKLLAIGAGAQPAASKEPTTKKKLKPKAIAGLVFRPGGFRYRKADVDLRGKPLIVLKSFAEAHDRIRTAAELYDLLYGDKEDKRQESTIRTHVNKARAALREAIRIAKVNFDANPLPDIDRGPGLAWQLAELP